MTIEARKRETERWIAKPHRRFSDDVRLVLGCVAGVALAWLVVAMWLPGK